MLQPERNPRTGPFYPAKMAQFFAAIDRHVLEHIGNRALDAASSRLEEYVDSGDPIIAGDSIWALRRIRGGDLPSVSEDLGTRLLASLSAEDGHLQGHALRTIGRLKLGNAAGQLRSHLVNTKSAYRWIVPEAAALIGGADGLAVLEEALGDCDVRVIGAALRGLGEIDCQVPEHLCTRISELTDEQAWIPFLEQSLGSLARTALTNIKRKAMRGKSATIYLSRHCTTAWNIEGRLQGTIDLPLAVVGIGEAKENIELIRSMAISRIVASTARRAYETAQIYAEALGVQLLSTPRLRELDHGGWEGREIRELLADPSSGYCSWMEDPASAAIPDSGESVTSAQQRISEAIRDVALSFRGETVLVVGHKHINAILMCALMGVPVRSFRTMIIEDTEPRLLPADRLEALCSDGQPSE